MATSTRRREERLEVRLTVSAKRMLQRAARAQQKTISAFVLDSGMTAAAEALADRREFSLPARSYEAFLAALDKPAKPKPRLSRLLTEPSVLE
jgi:uncharacterized protein (DUF1778 family)